MVLFNVTGAFVNILPRMSSPQSMPLFSRKDAYLKLALKLIKIERLLHFIYNKVLLKITEFSFTRMTARYQQTAKLRAGFEDDLSRRLRSIFKKTNKLFSSGVRGSTKTLTWRKHTYRPKMGFSRRFQEETDCTNQ